MSADGSQVGGGSILTEGAGAPQGGQAPAQGQSNGNGAPQEGNAGSMGRPDWLPEKFYREGKPDYEGLGKSYTSIEKLLGGEKVPKPRSDDDQEGWDRWFKAAGRPDKQDEYELKRPDSLPNGFYDEEAEKSFKTWAHVNGLTKKQAANLHENYVKTRLEQHQAYQVSQKQAKEQNVTSLKREWGAQYDSKVAAAKKALQAYADPDYYKYLDESGEGDKPAMIRAWARIGERMGGERRLEGDPQAADTRDPQSAIADFRVKYDKALHDRTHPDHDMRVKEYNGLFAKAFPGQPTR
jgi:hypothetical protein